MTSRTRINGGEGDWPLPPGWSLHYSTRTGSTNDDARQAALQGCADRSVFLADEQRAGRGRLGRTWLAPPGSSLLFSLVLRRGLPPIDLTALCSVAVAESIAAVTGLAARIKWPNDVMIRDRKVCGVLTEVVAARHRGDIAIVGIGVNVNLEPATAGLPTTATSLSLEAGAPMRRGALFGAILSRVDARLALDDASLVAQVRRSWEAMLWRRWQQVRVDDAGTTVHGVVEGLAPSGALLLRRSGGEVVEVAVGDIVW